MDTIIDRSQTARRLPYSTRHFCPECKKEFYGRKNRKFCSLDCKIISNNAKAAKMNFRVSEQIRMLRNNAEILDEVYSIESIPLMVEKEDLIKSGFFINCPTMKLTDERGREWNLIGEYVFIGENNGNQIVIMTRNDLKNI
jgi:hypothetical protein